MIPLLCDEIDHLHTVVADTERREQDLAAAARATLAAAAEAEPDPLYYLRDELSALGQLPSTGSGARDQAEGGQR
jgi:hypothetical protein